MFWLTQLRLNFFIKIRNRRGAVESVSRGLRRRPPHQELTSGHSEGVEEDQHKAAHRAHRLPSTEQSNRVLVHGWLCAAVVSGHQVRVLQHVRAAHHERPVYGLDSRGYQAHALSCSRLALPSRGVRAEARTWCLFGHAAQKARVYHSAQVVPYSKRWLFISIVNYCDIITIHLFGYMDLFEYNKIIFVTYKLLNLKNDDWELIVGEFGLRIIFNRSI